MHLVFVMLFMVAALIAGVVKLTKDTKGDALGWIIAFILYVAFFVALREIPLGALRLALDYLPTEAAILVGVTAMIAIFYGMVWFYFRINKRVKNSIARDNIIRSRAISIARMLTPTLEDLLPYGVHSLSMFHDRPDIVARAIVRWRDDAAAKLESDPQLKAAIDREHKKAAMSAYASQINSGIGGGPCALKVRRVVETMTPTDKELASIRYENDISEIDAEYFDDVVRDMWLAKTLNKMYQDCLDDKIPSAPPHEDVDSTK